MIFNPVNEGKKKELTDGVVNLSHTGSQRRTMTFQDNIIYSVVICYQGDSSFIGPLDFTLSTTNYNGTELRSFTSILSWSGISNDWVASFYFLSSNNNIYISEYITELDSSLIGSKNSNALYFNIGDATQSSRLIVMTKLN